MECDVEFLSYLAITFLGTVAFIASHRVLKTMFPNKIHLVKRRRPYLVRTK